MKIPDVEDVQAHDEPTNRLTRICETLMLALHAHPEFDSDVRAVIMVEDVEDGGMAVDGYATNEAAAVSILMHLKALLRVDGNDFEIIEIPESPEGA